MTELERFKTAIYGDKELRKEYLSLLDRLMTDGEITPEMASVAAKKLGYRIPADDIRREMGDTGHTGSGESPELAPDGRRVGCLLGFYLTWTDYWIWNAEGRCPKGGFHELDPCSAGKVCKKCRLALDERGVIDCYDRNGKEVR